jgi:hypothetical protein
VGKHADWPGDDLVLVAVEQLVSSPEAVRAALHDILSGEVQEAAEAGDTTAAACMAAVCALFRVATFLLRFALNLDHNSSLERGEAAYQALTGVLVQEESLPWLELLCLSLDPTSKC